MNFTISELQALLKENQEKLQSLHQDRSEVLKELKRIDTEIEKLSGESVSDSFSTELESASRPKRKKVVTQSSGRKTTMDYVKEILGKHTKGLELEDLSKQILLAGFETKSNNFTNTLYQALYKSEEVKRNDDGKYVLV